MNSFERLKELASPDVNPTTIQTGLLDRDIDAMAALLVDLYLSQRNSTGQKGCGSVEIDVSNPAARIRLH